MQRSTLREFSERDWQILEKLDRLHWTREYRRNGPQAAVQASLALWLHMRQIRPEWPSVQDRQKDLAHHIAMQEILKQAADGLTSR